MFQVSPLLDVLGVFFVLQNTAPPTLHHTMDGGRLFSDIHLAVFFSAFGSLELKIDGCTVQSEALIFQISSFTKFLTIEYVFDGVRPLVLFFRITSVNSSAISRHLHFPILCLPS